MEAHIYDTQEYYAIHLLATITSIVMKIDEYSGDVSMNHQKVHMTCHVYAINPAAFLKSVFYLNFCASVNSLKNRHITSSSIRIVICLPKVGIQLGGALKKRVHNNVVTMMI